MTGLDLWSLPAYNIMAGLSLHEIYVKNRITCSWYNPFFKPFDYYCNPAFMQSKLTISGRQDYLV